MRFFRTKAEKELDAILFELQQNLENNYKSVAQDYRRRLGERLEALETEGKTDAKILGRYRVIYEEYCEKMKDYHH